MVQAGNKLEFSLCRPLFVFHILPFNCESWWTYLTGTLMPCAAAAFPWRIIQHCSAGSAVTSHQSIKMEEKTWLFLPYSPCFSPRCPQTGKHHLPWLHCTPGFSLDSGISCLCSWTRGQAAQGRPLEVSEQNCISLGEFEQVQKQLLLLHPNLQTLREANNHNSQQNKAVCHINQKFVPLTKIIRLHAKRLRLEGVESRA